MNILEEHANRKMKKVLGIGGLSLIGLILAYSSIYVIQPGTRGILVTLGTINEQPAREGLGFKLPFVTDVHRMSIKQITTSVDTVNFSSDLQTVGIRVKVLYKIPSSSTVSIFQQYAGDPFDTLIAPRVQEALKEVSAGMTAEQIVKQREIVKAKTLQLAKEKIGVLLTIDDIVIENVDLSDELEAAIEQKMVQEQEAAKAKFIQLKATIEAQTAVIKAKGEAEAIQVRGDALRGNPGVVELMIVEKWNGISPLVVGGTNANILLPISTK